VKKDIVIRIPMANQMGVVTIPFLSSSVDPARVI
jgi:hypothetical protein